jgi:hypothetical protein
MQVKHSAITAVGCTLLLLSKHDHGDGALIRLSNVSPILAPSLFQQLDPSFDNETSPPLEEFAFFFEEDDADAVRVVGSTLHWPPAIFPWNDASLLGACRSQHDASDYLNDDYIIRLDIFSGTVNTLNGLGGSGAMHALNAHFLPAPTTRIRRVTPRFLPEPPSQIGVSNYLLFVLGISLLTISHLLRFMSTTLPLPATNYPRKAKR